MKPAAFSYHRPGSVQEALSLLQTHGDEAKLLAGGQSMVPMLNLRLAQPAHLIDLNDLSEHERIRWVNDRLEIGFLTRHAQVANSELVRKHCPLMAYMASTIGHDAIRHRGTLGGTLSHADPVAQMALLCVTLDAQMHLACANSRRIVPANQFFLSAMTTALQTNELLLQVDIPGLLPTEFGAYEMFNRRHGDYALVSVALTLRVEQGLVRHMRLGVAGVADKPVRMHGIEQDNLGVVPDDTWAQRVADQVRAQVQPEDDPLVPARYRQQLAHELTWRALKRILAQHSTV